jgi:hypothetical protein
MITALVAVISKNRVKYRQLVTESQQKPQSARVAWHGEDDKDCKRRELVLLFGWNILQQLRLNVFHSLGQRIAEFFKIFFIEKDFMFLILVLTDPFAFGDGDVKVFFGFSRLYVEEIRAFSCSHPFREYLIFVAVVFQVCILSVVYLLLDSPVSLTQLRRCD